MAVFGFIVGFALLFIASAWLLCVGYAVTLFSSKGEGWLVAFGAVVLAFLWRLLLNSSPFSVTLT